jgi:glycerophosphoryl diester phosphodiesterase
VSDPAEAGGSSSVAVHPYLRVPRPFVLAHRGLALTAPENSMPAFEAAVRAGVTHLETDVQATADGVLVVFHDDRLERLTELTGPVATVRWPDLRDTGLRGEVPVPLLADVLAAWPRLRVNVDLKADGAVAPFVDLVRSTGAADRVCTASFSERRRRAAVRRLARCGPVAHSLGFSASARFVALAAAGAPVRVLRRALAGALALQLPDRAAGMPVVTRRLVRAVHAVGAQLHVWTVDDPTRMRTLIAVGVDALVTNRADLALQITGAAGGTGPRADGDIDGDIDDGIDGDIDDERW